VLFGQNKPNVDASRMSMAQGYWLATVGKFGTGPGLPVLAAYSSGIKSSVSLISWMIFLKLFRVRSDRFFQAIRFQGWRAKLSSKTAQHVNHLVDGIRTAGYDFRILTG
jgi:hypothetical protein